MEAVVPGNLGGGRVKAPDSKAGRGQKEKGAYNKQFVVTTRKAGWHNKGRE